MNFVSIQTTEPVVREQMMHPSNKYLRLEPESSSRSIEKADVDSGEIF